MGMAALRDSEKLIGTIQGARYERENRSESYVTIPPAFLITDERGGMWTFGGEYEIHGGWYYFSVVRNDVDTGENASRIEYRGGKVRIWTRAGWKVWSGRSFI
jgi:hypothetical protein